MFASIIARLYKYYHANLSIITASALIIAFIFWFQISPYTFNRYETICHAIYGVRQEFNECMNPYWYGYNFNRLMIVLSLILFCISIIFVIRKYISKYLR